MRLRHPEDCEIDPHHSSSQQIESLSWVTPKSWLTDATQEAQHVARQQDGQVGGEALQNEVPESSQSGEVRRQPSRRYYRRQQLEVDYGDEEVGAQRVLPRRDRRTPRRFRDFQM